MKLSQQNQSFGKLVDCFEYNRLIYSFFKVAHCTLIAFDLKRKEETLKSLLAKSSLFPRILLM